MKIALVHDYLFQAGGAERVVNALHAIFPDSPIYTSIADPASLSPQLRDADIRTSWMQKLPGLHTNHKAYLPLYPFAIESFDLREYDLIISSSSAFGKGAITRRGAHHVCYCHTPMRFVWDYDRYVEREQFGRVLRAALPSVMRALRRWDVRTANRPDVYVANSTIVAERILRCYGRESEIIFPPVDADLYRPSADRADFYLIVSRLVPYKRLHLAIEAFNQLGRPLVVIGDGPDRHALEAMARPNVRFLGRLPDAEVAGYYGRCRALIFPGEEDFGITPLEVNASGRPVIAYRAGGALDTVVDGSTGIFFDEQSPQSLAEAVERSEGVDWDTQAIRRHAESFSQEVFRERLLDVLARRVPGFSSASITGRADRRSGALMPESQPV